MPSSNPNLSNPSHDVDKKDGYNQVIFQQGKPIIDHDLNDLGKVLRNHSDSIVSGRSGIFTPALDYREWAFVPCDKDATNSRNQSNFALTLGRLDTLKGVIDTSAFRDGVKDPKIIFDYAKIVNGSITTNQDQGFQNYILKGKVTATGATTTTFRDETKSFTSKHGLTGFTYHADLPVNDVDSLINTDVSDTNGLARIQIREGAARVVFTSGQNNGESKVIDGYDGNGNITVSSAFTHAPAVDDEYVIVPANTLDSYVVDFASARGQAGAIGLTDSDRRVDSIGSLIVYVQVFDNLVSADEDSSIQSGALGQETTWRNELRWCIRVARFNGSTNNDVVGSTTYNDLKIDHLYQYVLDSAKALLSHHASIDSDDFSDPAISNREYLQSHYWKLLATDANTYAQSKIGKDIGALSSTGISPSQILRSVENDKIIWVAIKALLMRALNDSFTDGSNDIQVLYRFSGPRLTGQTDTDTLSNVIYPGYQAPSGQKNFIEAGANAERPAPNKPYGEVYAPPNSFYSIPRVFHSTADLSSENMRSRILRGYGSDYIYDDTLGPIAFSSQADHLSFVDQMLLGMTGVGAWQGKSNDGNWLAGPVGHTWGLNSTISQSGYGLGSIKMVNALGRNTTPSGVQVEGGLSSDGSYKTRLARSGTHVINWDDPDGWSVYKERKAIDDGDDGTTITTREWSEGIAQAYEFQQGLNFRKLAIKTTAHKSMDLFTISERPPRKYGHLPVSSQPSSSYRKEESNIFFQIPKNIVQSVLSTQHKYALGSSYAPTNNLETITELLDSTTSNVPSLISANVDAYGSDTAITPSVVSWDSMGSGGGEHRNLASYYGPWSRFDSRDGVPSGASENTDLNAVTDLWANRCTAMRLRYHIGDFYPGANDSRGFPRNVLVDSLNLFVRLEPLSLAHWMTMPKHQHSVLANSFSMASGIEALLKISHGIGDTQKLINSSGSPLVQAESPIHTYGLESNSTVNARETFNEGVVDPTDLPFGHEYQPFVHWYHPAMDKIKSTGFNSQNTNTEFRFVPYEKWGRRSVIVPALVPSNFHEVAVKSPSQHFEASSPLFGQTNLTDGLPVANSQDVDGELHIPAVSHRSVVNEVFTAFDNNAYDDDGTGGARPANDIYEIYGTQNFVALDVSNRASTSLPVVYRTRGIQPSLFPYPAHFSVNNTPNSPSNHEPNTSITTDSGSISTQPNRFTFPSVGIQEFLYGTADKQREIGPRPVFLPASRSYGYIADGTQVNNFDVPSVGFHPVLRRESATDWDDISVDENTQYPWDEKAFGYQRTASAAGEPLTNFTHSYARDEFSWNVPVMRSAIRTRTVAAIVDLVRTSFETGLADTTLSSDYNFTMPSSTYNLINRDPRSVPSMGPDHNVDTLFVGDYGTSIAGFSNRSAFAHALNLGMGATTQYNLVPNGDSSSATKYRDSFDLAIDGNETMPLLYTFATIQGMGLQQKLLLNCSLRVLHHRPGDPNGSNAPRSLTEVFICNDRNNTNAAIELPANVTTNPDRKPFLHVASMHPTSAGTSSTDSNVSRNPNYLKLKHLSPMVSDTIGGNLDYLGAPTTEDFVNPQSNSAAMGDTFNVDPYDFWLSRSRDLSNNPLSDRANSFENSGVEIELMTELDLMHTGATARGLDQEFGTTNKSVQDIIPTANEMTMPGDHELVFVLYPGYYGAKMYDTGDVVNADLLPSVAGCHITATLEVNRPSEKIDTTEAVNRHYGFVYPTNNNVRLYAISSTNLNDE